MRAFSEDRMLPCAYLQPGAVRKAREMMLGHEKAKGLLQEIGKRRYPELKSRDPAKGK